MTSSSLKILAMLIMLIDHVGAILFPQYFILRCIGRISFPIYCFLLVEGYIHTHNLKKYIIRLILFAFISEIPFDLAFHKQIFYLQSNNIFFTLSIGVIALYFIGYFKSNKLFQVLIIFISCCLAYILKTDYSFTGVLMIVGFYIFKTNKIKLILYQALLSLEYINIFRLLAFIPISFYNGKKGFNIKYLFYIFYPAHLLILYFLSNL